MKLSRMLPIAVLAAASLAGGATAPTAHATCSQPLNGIVEDFETGCIENVICGTPHAVAVRAGIDEYVDPRMDCIE